MALGRILAAVQGKRRRWHVEIVRAGRDLNGRTRTPESLRRVVAAFEGRPLKVLDLVTADGRRINEHQQIDRLIGLEALNVVGHLEAVRYDDRAFGGVGGIVGEAVLLEGDAVADRIESKLEALAASGGLARNAIGLSFSGFGTRDQRGFEQIDSVDSVDFVTHPAAYGRVSHRVAASVRSLPMKTILARLSAALAAASCATLADGLPDNIANDYSLAKRLAERLKASADLAPKAAVAFGVTAEAFASDPVEAILGWIEKTRASITADEEAARRAAAGGGSGGGAETDPEVIASRQRAKAAADEVEALAGEHRLRAACEKARLPAKVSERLLASYRGKPVSAEDATRLATEKAKEIDEFRSTEVAGRVVVVEEKRDRLVASLARMLSRRAPKPEGFDPDAVFMGSIHKFARDGFGLDFLEAARGDMARRALRASIDAAGFDAVFAEALGRSMLAEYRGDGTAQDWRDLVNVVPERDFREKSVIATTYYEDLPEVSEGAPYLPLDTPTDRVEKYTMKKYGGTEDVTWERMLNDDLGLVAQMIRRLGLLCREMLTERVFTQFRIASQKTMADGAKLTSAAGARKSVNLSTTYDLSTGDSTAWGYFILAVEQMLSQTGGSGKPKAIRPRHIVIPLALAKPLGSLFADFAAQAADIPTRRGLEILGASLPKPHIDYGTTLPKDWFLLADPLDAEVFRLAFLGGKEDPDIFIANNEVFGSMFTNDKITIKVRHPYVIGVVDYAGIQGNDIA